MPLKIINESITRIHCDAIVNAANRTLLGGGGVDGAIHRAAGEGLLKECKTLGGCDTGDAKITGGYDLPCRFVIHTVGPVWHGGENGEEKLLRSCYRRSLELALEHDCESVAFPLISSGVYGYPKDKALDVAVDEIAKFLIDHDMLVYIAFFDRSVYCIDSDLYRKLSRYIDENYRGFNEYHYAAHAAMAAADAAPMPDKKMFPGKRSSRRKSAFSGAFSKVEFDVIEDIKDNEENSDDILQEQVLEASYDNASKVTLSLKDMLGQIDESFSEMLLRKIDEKGMTDVECYKKANIDRKLFSKIRSDRLYKPSKPTAIAFAVALELPLEEAKDLLMKAGFALSHSSKFDIIIEYFINNGNYNIYEINEALFAFDQVTLGV
ncbi:MAG: macro domain-containing protein [Clostridia bacterium]|nr:macro domain-containing protein [Clostridia bacterium]